MQNQTMSHKTTKDATPNPDVEITKNTKEKNLIYVKTTYLERCCWVLFLECARVYERVFDFSW